MGSIRGGAARKLLIYKDRDRPGWNFPREYENARPAWRRYGRDFTGAFEYADGGRWDEIDEIARPRWVPESKTASAAIRVALGSLPCRPVEGGRR